MKPLLSILFLGLSLSMAGAQNAAKKAEKSKQPAAVAKMVAKPVVAPKPAVPTISTLSPRGLHIGMEQVFTIMGKDLVGATVLTSHADVKPMIDAAASTATKVVVKLNTPAKLPRGSHDVWIKTASGESTKLKVYADDLAPQTTIAADFKGGPVKVAKLPASLWGTLTETGQHDAYLFTAKAGEELVLDLAISEVGSAAKAPTLEIIDGSGAVLVVNRGLDSGSDPFLAWKAPSDGDFTVLVSNTTMDGSANHLYRLTIGVLPYVTAFSPLTAKLGEPTTVKLIGHHLSGKDTLTVTPTKEGMMPLALGSRDIRYRSRPSLRVSTQPQVSEVDDHNDITKAQVVRVPANVNGRLARSEAILASADGRMPSLHADADHYAFDAKKGQTWIIETLAAQAGSPVDTKLEVLHTDGKPAPRVLLQAVRDSYNNFRGVDADNQDIRLQNWEEMELNEYVWFNGDVMKIFRMPRGPDAGCFFYISGGKRRAYFDTSATSHSLDEPCYIVEPHAVGSHIVPNGLPVFTVNYQNDDSGSRKTGSDSSITFTAPADGRYIVRVTDTRGWGGDRFVYSLAIREPKPDFSVKLAGMNPTVMPGASIGFSFRADRKDNFEDPIQIDISGLPAGYWATSPLIIEAGHDLISGSLHAAVDAKADADWSKLKITATSNKLTRDGGTFGKVTLGAQPKFIIVLEPDIGGKPAMRELSAETKPLELTLAPGQTVKAWLRAVRQNDKGIINLDVHGLPHGVIIDDIGLSGVQIREGENERSIFFRAANWVKDQDKLCHGAISSARNEHDSAGLQTSFPILMKIRKAAGVASTP
ncbi:MAG: PPC domain-containing protein [Verrucomicrobia bacterium]|nr:PPC domain-containing protein [Verrucomicrobiota bacterium]